MEESGMMKEEIPTRWVMFEDVIFKLTHDDKKPAIKVEEVSVTFLILLLNLENIE